jgi:hypothetical protein
MQRTYIAQLPGQGKRLNITGDPFTCKVAGEDTELEMTPRSCA